MHTISYALTFCRTCGGTANIELLAKKINTSRPEVNRIGLLLMPIPHKLFTQINNAHSLWT